MRTERERKQDRAERVFAFLDELIAELPVPPYHRELLQVVLGQADSSRRPETLAVELPLLVHEAITGDDAPALPVAGACTLLYLGADLFDSMLDHELPPSWQGRGPAEANLAASTVLASLTHVSIARLREEGTPLARIWALTRLFADTLLTMSAGQYEDLRLANLANVTLPDSMAMVERKSGSASALLARAGALLATEEASTIEAYTAFGSCLGVAGQLRNDLWDIWDQGMSQDLMNGKRTFPIVHALSTLQAGQREQLQMLLEIARESTEPHDEVRALLAAAGSVRYTALIMWLYRGRARTHLAAASPRGLAGLELGRLLDQISSLYRPGRAVF
jgi:geranylgeranyl diphosphate synthase, type I